MQIQKNKESEYLIGILWNMGNEFAREMMLKIAILDDVIQVRVYDLKEDYNNFVLDCYQGDDEAYRDGYIYEKIQTMKKTNNTKVVVFIVKIDNPTYQVNSENGIVQCVEARKIKKIIRDEFASKINGYFFDNLIHMSDNTQEMKRVLNVLENYEKYIEEDYLRKGYNPIIKDNKNVRKNHKNYISLLDSLEREER